ncbi:hypothetical protein [Flavobacterium sp.]|uniref:hypothetical protein n=1 Tax=Flavobacterium sp. TaxID=239 RepID=UPI00286DDE46|nr:hypothetical protein [Flavobacterium sp.]
MSTINKHIGKVKTLFCYLIIFLLINSCKPNPGVEVPSELKQLEKEIQKETNHSDNNFDPLSPFELERCEANLYIYVYIFNDTINASEENLNNYVKTISKRVNKVLIEKECLKKLIIKTSSENDKHLKNYNHHFEFTIE